MKKSPSSGGRANRKKHKHTSTSFRLRDDLHTRMHEIIELYPVTQTDILERALEEFYDQVKAHGYPGPRQRAPKPQPS